MEVREGGEAVPRVYIDLYLPGAFVRNARSGGPGRAASLPLKAGDAQVTNIHPWEPRTEQISGNGSRLLFHNAPNQTRGEGWESKVQAGHVEIYEGM